MDSISFIATKGWAGEKSIKRTRAERTDYLRALLTKYNATETSELVKIKIRESVLKEVYYFFPYFLKQHGLSKDLFDEAMQNMVIHTYSAIDKFDCRIGTPFPIYLRKYLKAAISDAKQEAKVIKTPISVRQKTLDDLVRKTQESKDADAAMKAFARYSSLTPRYIPADEETESHSDAFFEKCESEFQTRQSAESQLVNQELMDVLEYSLSPEAEVLSAKEIVVIKHRYGVFNIERMTLEEVADLFHRYGWRASKEWIFQLQKRALMKIKKVYHGWHLSG